MYPHSNDAYSNKKINNKNRYIVDFGFNIKLLIFIYFQFNLQKSSQSRKHISNQAITVL